MSGGSALHAEIAQLRVEMDGIERDYDSHWKRHADALRVEVDGLRAELGSLQTEYDKALRAENDAYARIERLEAALRAAGATGEA